jgi:hypothetical protein
VQARPERSSAARPHRGVLGFAGQALQLGLLSGDLLFALRHLSLQLACARYVRHCAPAPAYAPVLPESADLASMSSAQERRSCSSSAGSVTGAARSDSSRSRHAASVTATRVVTSARPEGSGAGARARPTSELLHEVLDAALCALQLSLAPL